MKAFSILFLVVLFTGHTENPSHSSCDSMPGYASRQQDSINWIQDFRNFRDAVYKNDRVVVKSFINFPIMNDNNEIWSLVHDGNEKGAQLMSADKIKPFAEKDFDRYYGKIFS